MSDNQNRPEIAARIWAGEQETLAAPAASTAGATAQDAATLVRDLYESGWNKGNLSKVDELFASDYQDHNPLPGAQPGRQGYKDALKMYKTAFPDLQISLDQVLSEGDVVAVRYTGRGTHQGAFLGIQPTGKQVRLSGMTFFRLKDRKIVEVTEISDLPGLLHQLGAVPG